MYASYISGLIKAVIVFLIELVKTSLSNTYIIWSCPSTTPSSSSLSIPPFFILYPSIVKEEDPYAFMIVTSANEIYGEGYKDFFGEVM